MRTSTSTLLGPPTRWKVWSTSTRKILFCVSRGMSPISSMNSVPWCASSSAPTLRSRVPFEASTPNSSDSIRSGVIAAALITPERMESELFGVEASNGTRERKVGALEEAHHGTLFIDEIGDMPRETQNKILRVLVDQTFQRVGGTTKVDVDVRIVSSTTRNLEAEIAAGKFREDLFHRLSVVPIRVPPLAERREDIALLVDYFMDQISHATGLPKRTLGEDPVGGFRAHAR